MDKRIEGAQAVEPDLKELYWALQFPIVVQCMHKYTHFLDSAWLWIQLDAKGKGASLVLPSICVKPTQLGKLWCNFSEKQAQVSKRLDLQDFCLHMYVFVHVGKNVLNVFQELLKKNSIL